MHSSEQPPSDDVIERCILSEFANCLKQIIESADAPPVGASQATATAWDVDRNGEQE